MCVGSCSFVVQATVLGLYACVFVCWHSVLHLCAKAHTRSDLQGVCSSARGGYGAPLAPYSGTKILRMVLHIKGTKRLLYQPKGGRETITACLEMREIELLNRYMYEFAGNSVC